MHLVFCLLVFFVLSFVASTAQTLSPAALEPGAFAELLRQNEQNSRQTFAAQLLAAERAFSKGDFKKAMFHYNRAATLGAPNSRWYLGKSALHEQLGEDLNAQTVLKDGVSMYPFSNRLALAHARLTFLRAEELPSDEEIDKMKLPAVAKVQVKALVAFRQNDLIKGLLETERAHYLAPDELIDAELALKYLQTSSIFSVSFSGDDRGQESIPALKKYEIGSFEESYLNSISHAVRKMNAVYRDSLFYNSEGKVNNSTSLGHLVDIRVTTLREFVNRGHLGRYQDPMLVDLYILDKAGHLKGATAQLFLKTPSAYVQEVKDELLALMPEMTAAQQYMDTQWSEDVDAFLAKF